jgi:DNA-binding XRE family transcriptional regulator
VEKEGEMRITMQDGPMQPKQYQSLRKKIGTQQHAADLLGVNRVTVAERETGRQPIDAEAEYAICYVAAREAKFTRQARRKRAA